MRKIVLAAAFAASVSGHVARADVVNIDLLPMDPKYNTPECASLREKAQNYEGIFQQSPGTYVFTSVLPGGTAGFMAVQLRKREMFKYEVEQACLTNPPKRPYLEPSATDTKD